MFTEGGGVGCLGLHWIVYANDGIHGGDHGPCGISSPLEGQGAKVSHTGGQLCLSGQPPIKILDTKAWANFPGWQYPVHTVTHQC